ncbi:MAG TPA: AbrB/MazE/SpoVT family DNA-binding domain-containing protein [Candidatus Bathyarchaeota archaeon]|nr:AbrB/MazE/SpoVT family DNA-binding domain-containing protein [Candidatus Bathyarchaeota archaeon]
MRWGSVCRCGGPKPAHYHAVEAIVSIDERGQIVLPKEVREKAGLKPKDKLAVVTHVHDGQVVFIMLIPVERLAGLVRRFLGPFLKEFLAEEERETGEQAKGA